MSDMNWDAATVARLREMRAAGDSARTIGRVLGATRNAVIGKLKRLGIPSPLTPTAARRNAIPERVVKLPKEEYTPAAPVVFSEPCAPVPTAALLPHHCRYVLTDEAPFEHCGRARDFPTYWCAQHRATVWRKAS